MARHRRVPTVEAKIIGPRFVQLKSEDTGPTAMSLQDRRFAPDGDAYTYANRQMWEGAAATEHSHSRSPQRSDVLLERRIAADNTAYTYTDFVTWYRTDADQMWETAAATEHSHSRSSQSSDVLPERRIASDNTAYTYTDFVNWYRTLGWLLGLGGLSVELLSCTKRTITECRQLICNYLANPANSFVQSKLKS